MVRRFSLELDRNLELPQLFEADTILVTGTGTLTDDVDVTFSVNLIENQVLKVFFNITSLVLSTFNFSVLGVNLNKYIGTTFSVEIVRNASTYTLFIVSNGNQTLSITTASIQDAAITAPKLAAANVIPSKLSQQSNWYSIYVELNLADISTAVRKIKIQHRYKLAFLAYDVIEDLSTDSLVINVDVGGNTIHTLTIDQPATGVSNTVDLTAAVNNAAGLGFLELDYAKTTADGRVGLTLIIERLDNV